MGGDLNARNPTEHLKWGSRVNRHSFQYLCPLARLPTIEFPSKPIEGMVRILRTEYVKLLEFYRLHFLWYSMGLTLVQPLHYKDYKHFESRRLLFIGPLDCPQASCRLLSEQ